MGYISDQRMYAKVSSGETRWDQLERANAVVVPRIWVRWLVKQRSSSVAEKRKIYDLDKAWEAALDADTTNFTTNL
jgi:hypothetical protein